MTAEQLDHILTTGTYEEILDALDLMATESLSGHQPSEEIKCIIRKHHPKLKLIRERMMSEWEKREEEKKVERKRGKIAESQAIKKLSAAEQRLRNKKH